MSSPLKWDNHVEFNSSPFRDRNGRLKVLVVFKKTRLQLYTQSSEDLHLDELIEHGDPSVDLLQETHDAHMRCLATINEVLNKYNADVVTCYRGELPSAPAEGRLVITVGGDGTVLDAAHYLRDSPLLGVNSDPSQSVGSLCVATADTFESIFAQVESNQILLQPVTRIEGVLDGKQLPVLALNELLIAHENPAAMSRYRIAINGDEEDHKNSGMWIGAPAGSTGAAVSAGGLVQSLDDQRIQVVAREPYFADKNVPKFLAGFVHKERTITVISKMPRGQIYVDGAHRRVAFGLGSRLELSATGHPLQLFVSEQMEKRRQEIGRLRENHHRDVILNRKQLMFEV